ncbi:hypothetical protein F2Q69_00019751 [Brassica cretica]|uniref:Uncharacterized protein n=1 Tax=Brassica cretica TaxID=69181 RepID=A0A8S9QCZ6_BRACR|nr:hypothetical protein F2Q69_00019751 [Brassica cretica]
MSDLTWSLRDVALIDRKRERPHVVAARRRSESDSQASETKMRATSRGRCKTSL